MTTPSLPSGASPQAGRPATAKPRRVHLVLRDGAIADAKIFLTEGQSLALFLGSRKGGWVNLVDVVWAADGEVAPHMVLQVDHLALAASIDGDIPAVTGTSVAAQRYVNVALENGVRLMGALYLAERQRLSDYLYTVGKFLPITKVVRESDQGALGDVAVNCAAIKLVRDVAVAPHGEQAPPAAEAQQYSVYVIEDTPITREAIRTEASSMTLITPGRLPDRRAGESRPRPSAAPPAPEPTLPPITAEQRQGSERAARHWLGMMSARQGLAGPDPRWLTATPTTPEIWRALAHANQLTEEDIAVMVGAQMKMPVAPLEQIAATAIALIPARIAKRLRVLPIREEGGKLLVATGDPMDPDLEQQLRFAVKSRIELCVAPPTALEHAIEWWYPEGPTA